MELKDILISEDVVSSLNNNLDYIFSIIPELKYEVVFLHKHPHHHLDVWNHTLLALSLSDNDFEIRLVLLLHDIGKPFSYQEEDGVRHFKGHPKVSSEMSMKILNRLGYDKDFINEVCYLIEYHDTPITKEDIDDNYDLSYKRYLIQKCDALAHNPNKLEKRKEYLSNIKLLLNK